MPIYLGNDLLPTTDFAYLGNTPVSNLTTYVTRNYTLGQFVDGGYVFYITGSYPNQHGLIAYPTDIPGVYGSTLLQWGCTGTNVTTSADMFAGKTNTDAIVAACSNPNIAARWCSDLIESGFDDWYLPSTAELAQLYINRAYVPNLKSAQFESYYWASTQGSSADYAVAQHFYDGSVISVRGKGSFETNSRAIRRF